VKENEQVRSQGWGKEQALANEREQDWEPSSELQWAELEQEARQIEREWVQAEPS
jgi:hypothetical protein